MKSLKKYSHFFSTFILGIATISDISFSQQSNFTLYEQNIFGSDAKIRMVPVNGGRFTLGSPKNEKGRNKDEGPVHDVLVDDFWMAEIEVTWDLYELFLSQSFGDSFREGYRALITVKRQISFRSGIRLKCRSFCTTGEIEVSV